MLRCGQAAAEIIHRATGWGARYRVGIVRNARRFPAMTRQEPLLCLRLLAMKSAWAGNPIVNRFGQKTAAGSFLCRLGNGLQKLQDR